MPNAPKAKRQKSLPILNDTMRFYDINNERRGAAWLATLAVESGELKYQQELASGDAYDTRTDLGNTAARDGDGRLYKGHGRIQITGKFNHRAYSDYLRKRKHLAVVDFVKEPHRLAEEPYATDSAGWFWAVLNDLNSLADKRQFLATQVRVNGRNRRTGLPNHWNERRAYYERALRVLPDDFSLTSGEHAEDDEDPDFDPQTPVESAEVEPVVEAASTTETRPQPTPDTPNTATAIAGGGVDDRPVAVVAASPAKDRSVKSLVTMITAALAGVGIPVVTLYEKGIEAFKDNPTAAFIVTIVALTAVAFAWIYVNRQTTLDVVDRGQAADVTLKTMDIRANTRLINVEVTPKAVPPPPEAEGVKP